ncbi:hypothetical protein [Streptomyces sp. NPDC051219]|uniref:hypothetical protein n=1 Tax=Streptomyces sp. NPDC051219 TaxID=3155283 RepID=UPI0034407EC4
MTTILFVHGTGVRSERYGKSLDQVRAGLGRVLPDVRVEPCAWGDVLGVAPRNGGGVPRVQASLPRARAGVNWSDAERAVWARLYDDPLFEIRLSALDERVNVSATSPRALAVLQDRLRTLPERATIQALVPEEGVADLRKSVEDLLANEEFDSALPTLAAAKSNDLIGRAITSRYIGVREHQSHTVLVPAEERDALARAIADILGGGALGTGRRALEAGWRTAQFVAKPVVRRYREDILDHSTPAAGDVLMYQARGNPLRTFLAERVQDIEGPVVLLGHSLGGIASFETLVASALPQVELLVTVGSQIPYLYGLDALTTQRYGAALPRHFQAPWLNIHDPVDLLGFPAEPQFKDRVRDVVVNTREPFPRAHSAYWATQEVYEAIGSAVKGRAK